MAQVRLVTANLPPHAMNEGKEGIAVAILKEAEKHLTFKSTIETRTINRALVTPQHHERNTLLFPVSRSKKREKDYRWIAPLYAVEFAFAHNHQKFSLEEAKKLDMIGVRQNSMFEEVLKNLGFDNVYSGSPNPEQLAHMLDRKRLDAWFGDASQLKYILDKKLNTKTSFKVSHSVGAFPTYLAGDSQTDETIIEAYRQAILTVQQSDFYKKLIAAYPMAHPISRNHPLMP